MNKIKIPMGSKQQRPKIKAIVMAEIDNGEIVFKEKWIIVNENGETLEAPIFNSKEDALRWLDKYYPERDFSPD